MLTVCNLKYDVLSYNVGHRFKVKYILDLEMTGSP